MLKQSVFFNFLNRRENVDFDGFLHSFEEDKDYINWNSYVLPLDYGDAELEYMAIRNSCALFDVSPLRKYKIQGAGAGKFLDQLLTRSVSNEASMRGIYVAFCNHDGNLKDDAILYKHDEQDYVLMPSDIDHSQYFESLLIERSIDDLSIIDCTQQLAGLAIQGPQSATLLKKMGFDGIEFLKPFHVEQFNLPIGVLRIARMGFTADLGYECWFETDMSDAVEKLILSTSESMQLDLVGYGLTALEACRLEGGFIVAGWDCATEMDPSPGFERSPYDLGLGWMVDLNGNDFVGRGALINQKKQGSPYVLRNFSMLKELKPEDGCTIWGNDQGKEIEIGSINCSSWSWGLSKMIGNASIYRKYADIIDAWIDIEGERHEIALAHGSLLKLERRNQVPAPIFK